MATGAEVVRCDLSACADPDIGTVAVLARMQVVARRAGYEVRLDRCPEALRELIVLAGLTELLPVDSTLAVEVCGEPEEREHPGGVEEEADARDLPA